MYYVHLCTLSISTNIVMLSVKASPCRQFWGSKRAVVPLWHGEGCLRFWLGKPTRWHNELMMTDKIHQLNPAVGNWLNLANGGSYCICYVWKKSTGFLLSKVRIFKLCTPLKTDMEPRSRKELRLLIFPLKRGDFSFHPILQECNNVTLLLNFSLMNSRAINPPRRIRPINIHKS